MMKSFPTLEPTAKALGVEYPFPPHLDYKMGVRKAVVKAVSLISVPFFISARNVAMRDLVLKQIVFYFASHLLQSKPWLLLNLVAMPKKVTRVIKLAPEAWK
ncbi:hypothetical protein L1987_08336 [Smallanthus sonchifolius]|uniref:Uncharacterized protein n=1 Tax=Smallanthus sonchifolius TaxID=185202 RepID=A0ACB9JM89_9ASTR|nr:hypothetical protein L1987_08336 [Smallanthus sonchifolius]